jgi:hypothetical protein
MLRHFRCTFFEVNCSGPVGALGPGGGRNAVAGGVPSRIDNPNGKEDTMKNPHRAAVLVGLTACWLAGISFSAAATERVRPGEWTTTLNAGGRTMSRSVCVSPEDASALNGDEGSIRAYTERVTARAGCKVTGVKAIGEQVTVTSVCTSGQENVGTTVYHGDRSETVNSSGAKAESKLVGPCQ